ncbi:MAG: ATP-dependent DNA helicase RecG [Chloroflexi bacterium]|nr:ATP-dependent DNA helicase RecG [Chloroflexota bacterium]
MKPSLLKLHKILRLEAERGYDNRAVMGGLERFMENWEGEARSDGLAEELIQAVGGRLRDYTRLTPASRFEALAGLLRRLDQAGEGLNLTLPPPASAQRAEAAAERPAAPRPAEEPPRNVEYPRAAAYAGHEPAALHASVTVLPQVGPRHAQTLERLGLRTLRDMLYYLPRRYDDYSQLKPINRLEYGDEVTVLGTVQSAVNRPVRGGRLQLTEAVITDGSGALRVTWFNQPWVAKRLRAGMQLAVSGKVEQYLGRPIMNGPEWEPLDQMQISTQRIAPVYSLTAQITQRWLRRLMSQVVSYWAARVRDPLPEIVRRSADLMELSTALAQTHFPDSQEKLKAARHRLAFDEIFLLQLGVLRQKRAWQDRDAAVFAVSDEWLQTQVGSLPYPLTGAQQRALADVRADLASGHPMNRLLQGDVGSGKTVIAALAVSMAASQEAQAAVMAPTGILAEQHYQTLRKLLAAPDSGAWSLAPEAVRLLVGATPEAEKRAIRAGLEDGSIQLVIGTHALIEDPVSFANLGLVVVDEQHRFGVEQRAALRSKGANPHLLVMTATPIPRSLALTIYGDLDLSVMDEMPPGRQAVSTHVLTPLERERAYRLIQREVDSGRQAFIIYPLVEESERSDGKAAVEEHARLQADIFPHSRLGLLHGRLKGEEKDEVMARFHDGEFHILVSTSVVEVGVDVPNATVMLIEGANRFGLAQLHQFRGRVGRGSEQSYCLLIPDAPDALENERLQVMAQTSDGFVLAEQDLAQRGPGDFLGTRQAGFSELQMANLADVHLIEKARKQAQALFERDPDLQQPGHQYLATALERFWSGGKGDVS